MKETNITRCLMFLITVLIFVTQANAGDYKGIADVEIYFNDQKATVDNATLKVGEQFTIKTVLQLKKERCFGIGLAASGFKHEENQPYEVIEGGLKFGGAIDYGCDLKVGENYTYLFKLKPTDVWTGGTAPLNIALDFDDLKTGKEDVLSFTVANIFISKETYKGVPAAESAAKSAAMPPQMSVFSIVDTPTQAGSTASATKKQPGFEIITGSIGLALAIILVRVRRGKILKD